MCQVLFNSLVYFQSYAPDKLNAAKIKKGLCIKFPLITFNTLNRYAPDNLIIAKIRKENKFVIT